MTAAMAGRDPRETPVAGDVLERQGKMFCMTRTVLEKTPKAPRGLVKYRTKTGNELSCWLPTWRAWAKSATVVKMGDSA